MLLPEAQENEEISPRLRGEGQEGQEGQEEVQGHLPRPSASAPAVRREGRWPATSCIKWTFERDDPRGQTARGGFGGRPPSAAIGRAAVHRLAQVTQLRFACACTVWVGGKKARARAGGRRGGVRGGLPEPGWLERFAEVGGESGLG